MARTHRKLFPAGTTTNQTQGCGGFCDPACPYNCYSFPDYYFSPPPPPILASDHSSPGNHISSYLIILASLFTVIFVVVGFYVIKVKCYNDWCGWRVNGPVPSQSDNSEDEFLDENQVDHPVWFITTIGLQQSIINSITVCKYRKGEGLIEGTECSVCLNEFREDETLRLLPKCNHAFHIPCIDTWLRSHTNCPLCRAGIVSNNPNPEAAVSNLASVEQNSTNLGRNQETQMENTRNDGELSNNNVLVIANGASENSAGTGEASEAIEVNDESNSKERVNVDRHQVTEVLNVPTGNHMVPNDETQTEIRSVNVSIDSSSKLICGGGSCPGPGMANSCSTEPESHPVDHIQDDTESHDLLEKDGDCSTTCKTMPRSSIADCLHVSPVTMKRSLSCSGRILSIRGYRNLNSSLPY